MFFRNTCVLLICLVAVFAGHQNAHAQTEKSSKYKGLQISRTDLISSLQITDSLLHFKEVSNTRGMPRLTAKGSFGARVEITGTEDNIIQTSWTVIQPASGALNRLAFMRMAFFINLLAQQDGTTWFFQQTFSYNQNPIIPINNYTVINGNRLIFIYDPSKKMFSLTVTPE